ncbi:MAG: hypothetical protein R2873_25655 [Caldilineaceae bacterium]
MCRSRRVFAHHTHATHLQGLRARPACASASTVSSTGVVRGAEDVLVDEPRRLSA